MAGRGRSELEAVVAQRSGANGQGPLQTRPPGRGGLDNHSNSVHVVSCCNRRVKVSVKGGAGIGTVRLRETSPFISSLLWEF